MDKENPCSCYAHGEGSTGAGRFLRFTYPAGKDPDAIRAFLEENLCELTLPTNHHLTTTVSHGMYGMYSRYQIKQHRYMAGCVNYAEVLEISDPPDGRPGIVFLEYNIYDGFTFSEWKSLEEALEIFDNFAKDLRSDPDMNFKGVPGFIRKVPFSRLVPWFYAVGEEELRGDYAVPQSMCDDPVYRLGEKFVVLDAEGIATVKTCMGTSFHSAKLDTYPNNEYHYRIVYWDDGTVWDESKNKIAPRPLKGDEIWITEAYKTFLEMMAGGFKEFVIELSDGFRFDGKLTKTATSKRSVVRTNRIKGKKDSKWNGVQI